MNTVINMATLVQLADNDVNQQVTDFGSLPLDIRQSLERQMAERRQDVVDAAAGEIVNLLGIKDAFLLSMAQRNAKLREEIASNEKLMGDVARQTSFGLSTQNFLPLAKQLGQPTAGAKADLLKIPADWTAPVAVTPAPAAPAPAAAPAPSAPAAV